MSEDTWYEPSQETPKDLLPMVDGGIRSPMYRHRPETELQALMEAAPHSTPEESVEELAPLREVLIDAFDQLDDIEKYVVEGCIIQNKSVRQVAEDMVALQIVPTFSKSGVHGALQRALAKLGELLVDNPEIAKRLIAEEMK